MQDQGERLISWTNPGLDMCGRFDFTWDEEVPAISRMLNLVKEKYPGAELPKGEISPSAEFPVLIRGADKADIAFMRWGMPGRGRPIINARSETANRLPLFRDAFEARRGVILTTGFYEWSHDGAKTKYQFRLPGSGVTYLAALYDDAGRYVILTEAANASMIGIHDRMPVILGGGEVLPWLRDGGFAREVLCRPGPILDKRQAG
jgi:Uncharacterized conserved protein